MINKHTLTNQQLILKQLLIQKYHNRQFTPLSHLYKYDIINSYELSKQYNNSYHIHNYTYKFNYNNWIFCDDES